MERPTTIQIRQRGTLTLPAAVREKYGLGDGDPLTLVDLDGAILLTPRLLLVPRLAEELERLRKKKGLSLKDLGGPARCASRAVRSRSRLRRAGLGSPGPGGTR